MLLMKVSIKCCCCWPYKGGMDHPSREMMFLFVLFDKNWDFDLSKWDISYAYRLSVSILNFSFFTIWVWQGLVLT
jgi:hypothetical protein